MRTDIGLPGARHGGREQWRFGDDRPKLGKQLRLRGQVEPSRKMA
jgi:hypothetical protein